MAIDLLKSFRNLAGQGSDAYMRLTKKRDIVLPD